MTPDPVNDLRLPKPPAHASLLFQAELQAKSLNVRDTLIDLRRAVQKWSDDDGMTGNVELAAAEALNNIVEHAYCNRETGEIKLVAHIDTSSLYLTIVDAGVPMPDAQPPLPRGGPLPSEISELPEGGFGWTIIRQLCEDVHYQRLCHQNHVFMRFTRH